MFKLAYCEWLTPDTAQHAELVCKDFVEKAKAYDASLMDKQKMHLLLHLPENILQFGPSFSFNTERWLKTNNTSYGYSLIQHCNKPSQMRAFQQHNAGVQHPWQQKGLQQRCGVKICQIGSFTSTERRRRLWQKQVHPRQGLTHVHLYLSFRVKMWGSSTQALGQPRSGPLPIWHTI